MAKGVGRGGREDRIRPQPSVRVVFGKIRVGAQLVQAGEPEDLIVAVQEIWDLRLGPVFLPPLVGATGGREARAPGGGSFDRGFPGAGPARGVDHPGAVLSVL